MLGYEEDPLFRETPLGRNQACRVRTRTSGVGAIWGRTSRGRYSVRAFAIIRGFWTWGKLSIGEDPTHDCNAVARRRGKECLCIFLCVEIARLHLLTRYKFIFYIGECTDIKKRKVFEHPHFVQNMECYFLLNFTVLWYAKPYRKKWKIVLWNYCVWGWSY